jgi:hypothetical protein
MNPSHDSRYTLPFLTACQAENNFAIRIANNLPTR